MLREMNKMFYMFRASIVLAVLSSGYTGTSMPAPGAAQV
jgi:hypothetical protein